jgi:hypothetical protein
MIEPLRQYYCDTCGNLIEKPSDGWVEWLNEEINGQRINHAFRICHHKTVCRKYFDYRTADGSLEDFLGVNGLIHLLRFLDPDKTIAENYHGPILSDIREYIEIFRRLQIPHYEEARQYWDEAEIDGENDGSNEIALYLPDRLIRLIEKYSKD